MGILIVALIGIAIAVAIAKNRKVKEKVAPEPPPPTLEECTYLEVISDQIVDENDPRAAKLALCRTIYGPGDSNDIEDTTTTE